MTNIQKITTTAIATLAMAIPSMARDNDRDRYDHGRDRERHERVYNRGGYRPNRGGGGINLNIGPLLKGLDNAARRQQQQQQQQERNRAQQERNRLANRVREQLWRYYPKALELGLSPPTGSSICGRWRRRPPKPRVCARPVSQAC